MRGRLPPRSPSQARCSTRLREQLEAPHGRSALAQLSFSLPSFPPSSLREPTGSEVHAARGSPGGGPGAPTCPLFGTGPLLRSSTRRRRARPRYQARPRRRRRARRVAPGPSVALPRSRSPGPPPGRPGATPRAAARRSSGAAGVPAVPGLEDGRCSRRPPPFGSRQSPLLYTPAPSASLGGRSWPVSVSVPAAAEHALRAHFSPRHHCGVTPLARSPSIRAAGSVRAPDPGRPSQSAPGGGSHEFPRVSGTSL
jgi:hypothetical protein